ncbi:MAG TPA: RHS repeat-associated core domain-containing protein [Dehalococcoidia bacterium]|nr:RHS repeat-associated core domain-containing protein [Dehalococcoidia bacterium]
MDSTGAVVNTYDYDAFGAVRASTGSQANEFKFTGEQADSSTELEYLRARYYDQETGSFISRDPMADQPGWSEHAFAYAKSNPVMLTDRSGLDPDEPEPVLGPLPTEEERQACDEAFHRCLEEWVPELHEDFDLRWDTLNSVCSDILAMCQNGTISADSRSFKAAVRSRLESIVSSTTKGGSILDFLPNLHLHPPSTGSAGLLDTHSKEGSQFSCMVVGN